VENLNSLLLHFFVLCWLFTLNLSNSRMGFPFLSSLVCTFECVGGCGNMMCLTFHVAFMFSFNYLVNLVDGDMLG